MVCFLLLVANEADLIKAGSHLEGGLKARVAKLVK
jgi:hypothetical protein